MRVAVQIALLFSILALIGAACGLAMLVSGYTMVGAFQGVPGAPRVSGMDRELIWWVTFFGASLATTIWLVMTYFRRK